MANCGTRADTRGCCERMKIAVACGGTGGHIFPGLAVADCLRVRGHDVTLWLSGRSVERTSLKGWGGEVVSVSSAGFPSGLSLRCIGVAFRLAFAVVNCIFRMRKRRPDVLLAMGSYSSVGPVLAARSYRVPVVLHEANAVPGRAIAFLSRLASTVAVTFDVASQDLGGKAVLTGLPLRSSLDLRFPADALVEGDFTVLIMGGSQGAHVLNEIGSKAVCAMHAAGSVIQVVHLTGPDDEQTVRDRYDKAGLRHLVVPFLEEMGFAYGAADVAVTRAGASTCMELAACGIPAVLIPLPSARRDHQAANARVLVSAGAADMIPETDLSVTSLRDHLQNCVRDGQKLQAMKTAMSALAVPDAAERVASLLESSVVLPA